MAKSRQTLEQKRAEVRFRAFHSEQFDLVASYMADAIRERTSPLGHLLLRGRAISPFLEIGCETAPISLALVNRLGCEGIAADISLDSLKAVDAYRERLGLEKNPIRVCCDAHNLPLAAGSVPLVVSWGTLHHFPDPGPVVDEVRRVLRDDGTFFVGEEPVRRKLSLNIGSTYSLNRMGAMQRSLLRLRLLPWIFRIDGREAIEWGGVEGKFSVKQWRSILERFEDVRLRFSPYLTGDLRSVSAPLWRLLVALFGEARASRIATSLFGGNLGGEAVRLAERSLVRVRTTSSGENEGSLRALLVLHKPAGADVLRFVWKGIDAGDPVRYRIYGSPVEPAPGERPGEHVFRLEGPAVRATVLDVAAELPRSGVSLDAVLYSGPDRSGMLPVDPPAEHECVHPMEALACPSCVTVSDHCRTDLCGTPCASACPESAIATGGPKAEVDVSACTGCVRCVPVCPLSALDRPLLEHEGDRLVCPACGCAYPVVDGVYLLLREETKRQLGYGKTGPSGL